MALYVLFFQVGGLLFSVIANICLEKVGEGDWRLLVKVSNVVVAITVLMLLFSSESIKYQLEKKRFD